MIPVTSPRVSGVSADMEHCYSDVLFLYIWTNRQSAFQTGGRVLRIGQANECTFYVLSTNYSYDQVLAACATSKMAPVIAGQAHFKIAAETYQAFVEMRGLGSEALKDLKNDFDFVETQSMSVRVRGQTLYQGLFRQRSSRSGWISARDLLRKDVLPAEKELIEKLDIKPPPLALRQDDHNLPALNPESAGEWAGRLEKHIEVLKKEILIGMPYPTIQRSHFRV